MKADALFVGCIVGAALLVVTLGALKLAQALGFLQDEK